MPLKQLALSSTWTVPHRLQSEKKFLLYPLEDRRGSEYGKVYPTAFIPVVNFFHIGQEHQYPEQSGVLIGNIGGRVVASVGSLDTAFPFILADAMRELRFTPNATPLDQVSTQVDLGSYDYVVTGKLTRSKYQQHVNIVPLGVLGLLGIPYDFRSFELVYEVQLFERGSHDEPLMTKLYRFEDSVPVGLYYNRSASYDMFVASLEKTVPSVIFDIARACEGR